MVIPQQLLHHVVVSCRNWALVYDSFLYFAAEDTKTDYIHVAARMMDDCEWFRKVSVHIEVPPDSNLFGRFIS